VRIEDVDAPRARAGAPDAILRALERHGFAWNGPVLWQSRRVHAYADALATLRAEGVVYECACTRRELATARIGRLGERVYPGTCRHGIDAARSKNRYCSLRVRVPDAAVAFDDRVFGPLSQRLSEDVGDFVVRRSDGLFAYQLAVVVDDAAQGITDVVRGADLLSSTPRQIFLQRALALPEPRYMHVPVVVDAQGTKLSKSTGAAALGRSPTVALAAAWRFLGQVEPVEPFGAPDAFWKWAIAHWQPARVERAIALPAPPPFA
jgi:glutamyl-Q tRNA(Asp) synthetase